MKKIIYTILIITLAILTLGSCMEETSLEELKKQIGSIGTDLSAVVSETSVTISGTFTGKVTAAGVIIDDNSDFSSSNTYKAVISENKFTVTVNNLTREKKYYCKAYISNTFVNVESSSVSFEIGKLITESIVITSDVTSITNTTATCGGNVTSDGGADVTARGVVWSTSQNPTVSLTTKTSDGTGTGEFTSSITGLTPGTTYYVRAYATNSQGTAYGAQKTFTTLVNESDYSSLSTSGTSNCYIVSTSGLYSFDATVIGNGAAGLLPDIAQSDKLFHTESVSISPLSAQILWQDVDGLVSGVRMSSDKSKVLFSTSASKGNALIAVYDNADPTADGAKILWSWHIWCTGAPSTHKYINRANREFTVLDRNLGATAADYGSGTDAEYLATYGLFYQWGRKDPFSRNDSHLSKEATSSSNGTIANTVSHPTIFYYNSSNPYDWFYGSSRNNYLWGNPYGYNYNSTVPYYSDGTASGTVVLPKKSVYDPCPPGYMVATKDMWTRFTTTGNNTNTSSEFNVDGSFSKGWRFYYAADKSGSTAWYPASGFRDYGGGSLSSVGSGGGYWSSSPNDSCSIYAGSLYFYSGYVFPLNYYYFRACGFAVRCLQE
jgi:hypothetical protein